MANKVVIWFLGSNGTGKTTQAKNIMNLIGEKTSIQIVKGEEQGVEYRYSKQGDLVACLGTISDRDCCGCDTLKNKEQIKTSYLKAIDDVSLVIIDGIMSTNTWIEFIRERDVKLIVVHLKLTLEENIQRVLQRRGITEEEMSDEKLQGLAENLLRKLGSFAGQFKRQSPNAEVAMSFDANIPSDMITENIIDQIYSLL